MKKFVKVRFLRNTVAESRPVKIGQTRVLEQDEANLLIGIKKAELVQKTEIAPQGRQLTKEQAEINEELAAEYDSQQGKNMAEDAKKERASKKAAEEKAKAKADKKAAKEKARAEKKAGKKDSNGADGGGSDGKGSEGAGGDAGGSEGGDGKDSEGDGQGSEE